MRCWFEVLRDRCMRTSAMTVDFTPSVCAQRGMHCSIPLATPAIADLHACSLERLTISPPQFLAASPRSLRMDGSRKVILRGSRRISRLMADTEHIEVLPEVPHNKQTHVRATTGADDNTETRHDHGETCSIGEDRCYEIPVHQSHSSGSLPPRAAMTLS